MKITKKIVATALVSVMVLMPAGCSKAGTGKESQTTTTKEETTTEATTTTAETTEETTTSSEETTAQSEPTGPFSDPSEPELLFVSYNGVDVRIGMKYEDIEDALGLDQHVPQTEDAQSDIVHSKEGLGFQITENRTTGRITSILVDEAAGDTSSILLGGKIKIGGHFDAVTEIFGNPGDVFSVGAYYYYGRTTLVVTPDERNVIKVISIMYKE